MDIHHCKNYDNDNAYNEVESYFVNIFNNETKFEIYDLKKDEPSNYYKHNIKCILDIRDVVILLRALRLIFPNINSDNIYSRLILARTILCSIDSDNNNEYTGFAFEMNKMIWFCMDILERNNKLRERDLSVNEIVNETDSGPNEGLYNYLHELDNDIIANITKYKRD